MQRRDFIKALFAPVLAFFGIKLATKGTHKGYHRKSMIVPTPGPQLMGYRGGAALDAGYFYCPYIPLQVYKT